LASLKDNSMEKDLTRTEINLVPSSGLAIYAI
jgi:hypothetical protein